jgi:hypothetical protein
MTKPLSRHMLLNLSHIGDDWSEVAYMTQLDPLVARGLIEARYATKMTTLGMTPVGRLTEAGRAALVGVEKPGLRYRQNPDIFTPEEQELLELYFADANDPVGQSIMAKVRKLKR